MEGRPCTCPSGRSQSGAERGAPEHRPPQIRVWPFPHGSQVAPLSFLESPSPQSPLPAASTLWSCSALEFSGPKACKKEADPTLPKGFTPRDYPGISSKFHHWRHASGDCESLWIPTRVGFPAALGRHSGWPRGGGRWGPEGRRGSAPARMMPFSTLGSKAKPQHPSGFEQRLSADSAFARVPCCGPGKTQSPGWGLSRRQDL